MSPKEKKIRFVGKLLKLTRSGELIWTHVNGTEYDEVNDTIFYDRFSSSAGGMNFVIYQKVRKLSPHRLATASYKEHDVAFGNLRSRRRTILEVFEVSDVSEIDKDVASETIVDIDDMPIVCDLYEAIKNIVPSVRTKMDAFLAEDVTHAH